MKSKNGFIAAIVILALALIGTLVWGVGKNNQVHELEGDNSEVTEALDAMTSLRDNLAREVDSLAGEYDMLASENVELSGELAGTKDELSSARSAVSRAKRNAAAEINDLRSQIEALQSAKADLMASIGNMQAQNDSLRVRTGILEGDLAQSTTDNEALSNLNTSMQGEIKKLSYENFKATAFQISPEVKRGNATAKSSRARRIVVDFDIANVPQEFRGVRPLFIVITDETGTPIPRTDYITTTVQLNGKPHNIMPVETREENIGESQRLSFTHVLEDKLDAGYYRLAVYTDIGLLGASTFRLR